MRKMRRIIALALALLCILVFSSCGTGGRENDDNLLDPENAVTITLWHYYVGENQRALNELVGEFNRTVGMEQGIIVDAVAKGDITELEEAVSNSANGTINSEQMPDIFSSYSDKALELDGQGVICDLTQYFTEEERAMYVDAFISNSETGDGRLLSLPIVKSTELVYVNGTKWNEFTRQTSVQSSSLDTWEGVLAAAREYYNWTDAATPDVPGDGKTLVGFDSVANFIITAMMQQGIEVIDGTSGKATLDEAALRRVFDIYYTGISMGYFSTATKARTDDVKSGEIVVYIGSSSNAAYFPTWIEEDNSQIPIDFISARYPHLEGCEAIAIQQGAGMCVSVSEEQRQLAASIFLKWFTMPEQNNRFAMTTGYIPVMKDAFAAEPFDASLSALREDGESSSIIADVYEIAYEQVYSVGTYAAKPFSGSYSIRAAIQSTLVSVSANGLEAAQTLRLHGASDAEILTTLDLDTQFDVWVASIARELDTMGIDWE